MSVAGPVPTPGTPQPRPLPPAAPIHDDSLNVNDPSLPPPPAVPPRQPPQHPPAPPQGAAPPLQPATPGKIEVQVMDGNDAVPPTVRLKWSPAHSGAAYSVIYKSEKDPQSSHQVYFYGHDTTDRSDTTPATENTHRVELEHGFPYGYGITYGVYVKGETHMHAVSDRVIVHAEVEAIRVTPGDRTATIEWDPPSEAAIIGYKVYIKPKGEPDAAAKGFDVPDRTQKSVPFSGLKNDVPYEVRVCCVYQDLNEKAKQQAQTGQPAQVLPHTAGRRHAFMVNATLQWQIAAKILESSAHQSQPSVNPRVAIRWNRDQIVRGARLEFHQSASGFPALQPCAFHEMLGTRIGSELDPNDPAYATSQTFTYDVASNTSHVVGYQKYNGLAYPSNVVPVSTVGDITDVDAIDTGNMIFFTWMWPESANPTQEVTIYGFPDGQNNARPFTKTIDRQTYDQVSTFGISKEKILGGTNTMNTGVWFLVNTTPLNSDGNPQHPSAGQYIFVSHRFRIEYWFTKEVGWLQMKLKYVPGPSDRPLVVLPALELHYEVGRWPLKPSDRSLLQQFPPGVVDNREVTLDLRHQLPTNSYGRLFVSNLDTNLKYDQLLDKLFKDYEGRVDLWHFVRHNRISTFFTQRYELLPRPHDKGVITLADMRLG
jgi:hypothetical protein